MLARPPEGLAPPSGYEHGQPPLRVAVDASWFGPSARGMARHAATVLSSRHVTPVLLNHPRGDPGAPRWSLPQPVFEQLVFARAAARRGADVCLSPYNTAPLGRTPVRRVVVVHDLIYLDPPPSSTGRESMRQALGRRYRSLVVPRAARAAAWVVTVSEMMKRALVDRFGLDATRVLIVPNAGDPELYEPYSTTAGDTARVLAVSGSAPHKNVPRLLAACDGLVAKGVPLTVTVVGVSPDEGASMLRALAVGARARAFTFLKGIPRPRLVTLYREASVFVMPSLAEGFGIPLLEALAAGLPCVASDLPIFREIAGADCSYFDPLSVESLAAALRAAVSAALAAIGHAVDRAPARSAERYSPTAVAAAVDALWLQVRRELAGGGRRA